MIVCMAGKIASYKMTVKRMSRRFFFVFWLLCVIRHARLDREFSVVAFAFAFVPFLSSSTLVIEDPVSLLLPLPCVSFVQAKDTGSPIGVGDDRKRQRILSTPVLSLSKEISEHIQG